MSLPGGVSVVVDEEDLIDRVSLDDHRSLFVTAEKAIAFRKRSLLTEESVDVYPTDADRIVLEEAKRQATVRFEYADGSVRELQLPTGTMAAALKALLASVIRATDVVLADESIQELYRFKELTVIVTDQRLLKHVGQALWAGSFDELDFGAVRDLRTEEGQVSTGVIIETADGRERLKVPHDEAVRFVDRLEESICAYHGVSSIAALRGDPEADEPDPEPDLDRLESLPVGGEDEPGDESIFGDATEAATVVEDGELLEQIAELRETIEHQEARLAAYKETLETLEDQVSRDR